MKKQYFSIIMMFASLLLGVEGCTYENLPNSDKDEIFIRLSCTDIQTKGTAIGVGRENYVETLDIFVYADASAASPLFAPIHVDVPSANREDGTYEQAPLNLTTHFGGDPDNVKNAVVYAIANCPASLSLPTDQPISALKALALDEATTTTFLASTRTSVAAEPKFVMVAEGSFKQGTGTDAGKAVADLKLQRLAAKVSLQLDFPAPGTIITHGTDDFFGSTVSVTTTEWEPMLSGKNARCYLVNAGSKAVLGGASDTPSYPSDFSLFTYDEETYGGSAFAPFYTYPLNGASLSGDSAPYIKLILPWRYSTTIEQDGHDVVIDQNIVELYYKIMLPSTVTSIDANTFYQLTVTMNVLGGEANRPTVIVAEGLHIQDWNALNSGSSTDMSGISFVEAHLVTLSPDGVIIEQPDPVKNEFTVSVARGAKMDISFIATEEVEMTVKSISFIKFGSGSKTDLTANDGHETIVVVENDVIKDDSFGTGSLAKDAWRVSSNDNYALKWITMENNAQKRGGIIHLNHSLTADYDHDDFAITPYTYELEIKLKTRAEKATITIIQQPVILFEQKLSTGNVIVNNTKNSSANSKGYAFPFASNKVYTVNGAGTAPNASSSGFSGEIAKLLGAVYSTSRAMSGEVSSKFMYIVEAIPFTGAYITNPLNTIDKSSTLGNILTKSNTDGSSNNLPITNNSYYGNGDSQYIVKSTGSAYGNVSAINYKAPAMARVDGDNDNARKYVAPKFIIASGYGMSGQFCSFGQAVLRCATYQEDGYPAGRWRLPTEKEIEYIYMLSHKGYLPNLLTGDYWASSGRLFDYTASTNSYVYQSNVPGGKSASVRCVYDTWYWGEEEVTGVKGTYTIKTTK